MENGAPSVSGWESNDNMANFAIILAAAGSGSRFHDAGKKTYAMLNEKPVWRHSADRFAKRDDVKQMVIVIAEEDDAWFRKIYRREIESLSAQICIGGKLRSESVCNAIEMIRDDIDFIAIHDAARACVSDALIDRVFSVAREHGNATPAIPVSSTLKRSSDGVTVDETVDRRELYMSQTPQVFSKLQLERAYASKGDANPTDEAQLLEAVGDRVFLAEGCPLNSKLTSRQDFAFAAASLRVIDDNDQSIRFDGPNEDTVMR